MSNDALNDLQEELKTILGRQQMPEKALITAGMPYANAPFISLLCRNICTRRYLCQVYENAYWSG